uniref:Dickkopf protein n=1 Tax=Phallusia mammillata TaxID=59560 RepID=A0A6F9DBU5_9ASCI|nr:dickkopf protein precursor [Phallusia mammillata]
MYIVKFCLVFVIILQYTQFSSCEGNSDDEESQAVMSPRPSQDDGLERTQRAAHKHHRCPGNRKSCTRSASAPSIGKKQAKQCKKKFKKCKNKRDKKCKNNLKCYKKKTKKCKKRNKVCLAPRNDRPASQPERSTPSSGNLRSPVVVKPKPETYKQKHEACVRDSECMPNHCCARYRTGKRCQEMVPIDGVCPIPLNKNRRRSAQFFERCPCAPGLYCQKPLTDSRHYTCQIAT